MLRRRTNRSNVRTSRCVSDALDSHALDSHALDSHALDYVSFLQFKYLNKGLINGWFQGIMRSRGVIVCR
jgi:hypothetical protein